MSTKVITKPKAQASEAEAFNARFGHLKQHRCTAAGPSHWKGVALSLQTKKTQPWGISTVIWIDRETCERYGIPMKADLRFNIYHDGRSVMIETVPAGSSQGVKATIHANALSFNWHSLPSNVSRERRSPVSMEGVSSATTPDSIQLAWDLPDWFFAERT